MKLTASAFFGLALLLCGNAVWAQGTTPSQSDEAKAWSQFFFEEVLQRSCDDPTMESAIALPQPKLILQATDEGKGEIKARAGFEVKKLVASLEVKSPRKSPDETTTLANQEGLSKGTTLDAKVSWFWWNPPNIDTMKENWAKEKSPSDLTAKCTGNAQECADREMQKAVDPSMDTGWRMKDFLRPSISRPSGRALLGSARYDEATAAYRAWMRAYDRMIPVFTVNGHADQKDFDFLVPSAGPPTGLKQTSESHTNYNVTGSVGAYLWGTIYSSLNYSRGTEFEGGEMKDFCTASGTGILSCQSHTIAPPKKGRAEKLEFEARGLAGLVGFSAHVTRDLQAKVTMVDVPIYLLQNLSTSKMELNLGARLQWRSDTRKYAVSVFIGPALSSVLRMGR
jgi:hypothetical protein